MKYRNKIEIMGIKPTEWSPFNNNGDANDVWYSARHSNEKGQNCRS